MEDQGSSYESDQGSDTYPLGAGAHPYRRNLPSSPSKPLEPLEPHEHLQMTKEFFRMCGILLAVAFLLFKVLEVTGGGHHNATKVPPFGDGAMMCILGFLFFVGLVVFGIAVLAVLFFLLMTVANGIAYIESRGAKAERSK